MIRSTWDPNLIMPGGNVVCSSCMLVFIQTVEYTVSARTYQQFLTLLRGHALHEEGLKRQLSAGIMVTGRERRAAVVLRGSRLLFYPFGINQISPVRASEEHLKTNAHYSLEVLEGLRGGRLLGESSRRLPALPSPAPPCRPTACRPAGFRPLYVGVFDSTGAFK